MVAIPLQATPVPVGDIDATGTPDSTTYLRGDGTWSTPPSGGSGSGLLAVTQHRPATADNKATTSTAYVDADATNLAVTFTAPASGAVVVTLEGFLSHSAAGGYIGFNLRDASGDVTGTDSLVFRAGSTSDNLHVTLDIYVSGLTAGAVYTYKFGWKTLSGTANMLIGGASGYRAVMKVQAA